MILIDTAPIVAAAFRSEEHYRVCTELFTGRRLAGRRFPRPSQQRSATCSTDSADRSASGFLAGVAEGAFEQVDLSKADYARMAELSRSTTRCTSGPRMRPSSHSTERLEITETSTLDRRHFTAVRPHVEAFTLLPERL